MFSLKKLFRRTLVAVLASLALFGWGAASAQDSGSFYLERSQISGAPDDPLLTWRPYLPERTRFTGAATLSYALNPLRSSTLTNDPQQLNANDPFGQPFEHVGILHLSGGVQLFGRVGMELTVPIAFLNTGGDIPSGGDTVGGGFGQGAAVYDTRLSLRVLGYESDDRKFRFGAGGAVFLPTGNEVNFAGDGETTVWLFTNFEYAFGDLLWVGMIGPHFRPEARPTNSVLAVGNELRLSTGLFKPIGDEGRLTIGGELWGQTGIASPTDPRDGTSSSTFFSAENTTFEWLAQAKYLMGEGKEWYLQGGAGTRFTAGYGGADIRLIFQIGSYLHLEDVGPKSEKPIKTVDRSVFDEDPDTDGDGYPDTIDQCPTIKEDGKPPFPDDGCPDLDRDDDGIPDKTDKCPDDPEDFDGIEDDDGCPEDDADGDGIRDEDDACPDVPGVANKDPKKHGCPKERRRIVVDDSEIQLLESIQFAYNEARILPVSFPILDEVVDLLRERQSIRLGIYGHTDNRGGDWYNKQLSARRASAVVAYLVDKGLDARRFESAGFGEEKPIDTNATKAGRAKNRRVEFKILEQ